MSHEFLQSVYIKSSHASLKNDHDLLDRLQTLLRGRRGLDAGCGAGARDVHYFWQQGYDIQGIDAVEENIQQAKARHPDIADRVAVADLRQPLAFPDASFDFVMCNAVIQHIPPHDVYAVTLSELSRVLSAGGVLQLMFKNGDGVKTVYDRDYGVDRTFQLYDEHEILRAMASYGLTMIEAESPGILGGYSAA